MTKEEMQALQAMFEAEREHTAKLVREELQPIKEDLAAVKEDVATVKADVKHVKKQVDVLYTWVDRVDLDVKGLKKAL